MNKILILIVIVLIGTKNEAQTQLWGTTITGGQNNLGVIFKTDGSGNNQVLKYDFSMTIEGGSPNYTRLAEAPDGKLYGMTYSGGINGLGVLFQYDPATATYIKKVDFDGVNKGSRPRGSLLLAADGKFYGMTSQGGVNDLGVLFQYDPTTSTYVKKIDFDGTNTGSNPQADLIQASDGKLYGMTNTGVGTGIGGVIFKYDIMSSAFAKLFEFNFTAYPRGSLMQASDGKLYGTTYAGGINNLGVLFQFDPITLAYTKKLDFNGVNGSSPVGSLMQASDGKLYGTTFYGGTNDIGVLFQYDISSSTYLKKYDFNFINGKGPCCTLLQATDGKLYGTTQLGGVDSVGVIFQYDLSSSVYTKKFNFSGNTSGAGIMGSQPIGSLMQTTNGNLYGLTYRGGAASAGVLFQYDLNSSTYLKKVDFNSSLLGIKPDNGLLLCSNGKLYGTASAGLNGNGVLYKYDPASSSFIKEMDFNGANGNEPQGNIMQASDDKIYGVTNSGGLNDAGVLYQYDIVNSIYSKKIDFNPTSNGKLPAGPLIQAADGKLYGMTQMGGTFNLGVLFQYDPLSSSFTKKVDFNGTVMGDSPSGALIQASDGKLYGMTFFGGVNDMGVLFQYDPITLTYTKKIDFNGTNGRYPSASLIQTADGKLYGTTQQGGANNMGVLFQYDPVTSTFVKKIDFAGTSNGRSLEDKLLLGSDGKIYGTTRLGGLNNLGVLFQYDPITSTLTKKLDFNQINGSLPSGGLVEIPLTLSTSASNTTVCAGTQINIVYNIQGSFDSGNIFIAQLSDASGSFSSPVSIGTYSSTLSGSISAIIPVNTLQGNGYRVRVVSTSPAVNGSDNGANIQINASPSLSIVPIVAEVCNGVPTTLTASGASTYTWSGGVTNGVAFTPTGTTIYSVTGTSVNGCEGTNTKVVTVNYPPSITITGNSIICVGSSLSETASGAYTYTWNTGANTNNISDMPSVTTSYTVSGSDINNCGIDTRTLIVTVDQTCADVWPGDANSDGYANNLDVLELGLHYMQTGVPRASVSNSWQSFHADNWTGTISNGQNLNHSDCNGDGIIDSGDTLAIYNNYGFTHAFRESAIETTNPQLSIVPNENMLLMGYWGSADVFLGDASNPITNINGLAFTVDFDNNIMESDSVYLEYINSFIDASNQNLKFRKLDFANGKLYTTTTHTNNINVSGNGKIGTLHYKIKYPLSQTYTLNIGISQANQSDASGMISSLTSGSGTVEVINGVVGVQSLTNDNLISVSPNPAANEIIVRSNSNIEKIEITDLTGQIILSEQINSRNHKLNLENISNGVYFVKAHSNSKQIIIKKLVVQK